MDAREIKPIDTSGRNGQPAPEFWDKRPAEGTNHPTRETIGTSRPFRAAPADMEVIISARGTSRSAWTVSGHADPRRAGLGYPHPAGLFGRRARRRPGRGRGRPHRTEVEDLPRGEASLGGQGRRRRRRGQRRRRPGRWPRARRAGCHQTPQRRRWRGWCSGRKVRLLSPTNDATCRLLTGGSSGKSGGYGSSGADGAAGGHVFVTVHDEDADLLMPLLFDVRGGAGGISGHHGQPGDGGVGGQGGEGHVW